MRARRLYSSTNDEDTCPADDGPFATEAIGKVRLSETVIKKTMVSSENEGQKWRHARSDESADSEEGGDERFV